MSAISIENLNYYYPSSEKPALRGVDLEVKKGEFILICGSSGGGKSTLCRCILGLIPHFYGGKMEGQVEVLGMNTHDYYPSEIARKVGMISQNPEDQLIGTSVEGDIAFGLENLGMPRQDIERRVEEVMEILGIHDLRSRPPDELSSGQQQKVAIASILAMRPKILVLDEPTSELDPRSAAEILEFVESINEKEKITIVLTEHRLENTAQYADRIVVISDGKILHDGPPREVLEIEDLLDVGVNIPKVTQLALALRKKGIRLKTLPLNTKEMSSMLMEMFK